MRLLQRVRRIETKINDKRKDLKVCIAFIENDTWTIPELNFNGTKEEGEKILGKLESEGVKNMKITVIS